MSQQNKPGPSHDELHSRRSRDRLLAFSCALLVLVSAWLTNLTGPPAAPVDGPPTTLVQETPAAGAWQYPSASVFYSIEADDFSLLRDGSFELRSDNRPGGLSQAYLENCLKLTPAVPFTVEPLDKGAFRIVLENGRAIPRTQVELPPEPSLTYKPEPFKAWIEPHLAARVVTEEGNGGAPIDRPFRVEFSVPMDFDPPLQSDPAFSPLTIFPELPCSIETSSDAITITPDGMMSYATEYSILVSAALKGAGGESFPSDPECVFSTESRDFSLIMTNQNITTARPDEKISMEYQLDTAGRGSRPGDVTLYSIDGSSSAVFASYLAFLESTPLPEVVYPGEQYDRRNLYYQTAPGAVPPENLTELDAWKGDFPEGLSTVDFENPGPGFYVLRTTIMDTKTREPFTWYKPIQVTTPSVYMQSAKGNTLLWLNDCQTGEALSGHTIRFLRGDFQSELASAVTDADGSALLSLPRPSWQEDDSRPGAAPGQQTYLFTGFPNERASMTPEEAQSRNQLSTVFVIYDRQGTPVYADTTASLSDPDLPSNLYYSFLYLDRALYRPTDEIHFWGYLKPYAHNPAPMPQSLTVRFDPAGLDQRVSVQVAGDGTYDGVIKLDRVVSAEYEVTVEYDVSETENQLASNYYMRFGQTPQEETARTLDTQWIEVNEFQKPSYTIETATDKPLYRWGDEITVTISPSFFDGTPVPHMPLECSVWSPSTGNLTATTTVETDETGKAVYKFHAGDSLRFDSDLTWTPKRAYFYVKIVSEGENVTAQGHYNYVPADIAIRSKVEIDEHDNARLTLLANAIRLDGIRSEEDLEGLIGDPYSGDEPDSRYDILLGEPADISLTTRLELEYCRPYDGTYDEKYYDYTNQTRTLSVDVKNGRALIMNLANVQRRPETYLYVSAKTTYAAKGCTIAAYDSAYNGYARFDTMDDAILKGYSFNVYLNGESSPVQERDRYTLLDTLEAGAGDSMRFSLCRDGQELPNPDGKLLYSVLQDGVAERGVVRGNLTLTEKPAYANSMMLVAAYFDGKEVYPVVNCEVSFRKESVRLNIETSADKDAYLPGDQVRLRAKVTDGSGNPVSANLCFSVVDEAVFALREQYFELLNELYGEMTFYNSFVNKYTTRTGDIDPYHLGGDGGKGDGENLLAYDVFRKNFKDTALFYPVKSDAQGEASVSFTLPDNLTSWRVTTLAVDNAPMGGQSRSQVITSLPFFVKPVISSKYLAGDDVTILLKGHGSALEEDSMIDYTVTLRGNGMEDTKTYRQKAHDTVTVSFGKLPEGDYVVTSTGGLDQRRDTVELPLSVIHNNLEITVHQSFDPKKPVSFPASRYPVAITLYNADFQTYYDCVNALSPYYCNVLDQRMARYISKRALLRTCTEEELPSYLRAYDDLSVYQRDNGGISQYATDNGWAENDTDPVMTAWAMLTAPEQFSRERALRYLLDAAGDSAMKPLQQAAALAGAAALDPSAAQTIRERMNNKGVSLKEKLWYGIGLACAGDTDGARALYEETVVPALDTRGGVVRMSGIGKQWENDEASALAWVIATELGISDADGFAGYFTQDVGWLGDALLACGVYVQKYPLTPVPLRFSYQGGGVTGEIDLSASGSKTLTFDSAALKGLQFLDVPEGVAGLAYYVGEPDEANITPAENFRISKEVKALEGGKYLNTLTVSFDKDAPYGYYGVSDWIPSNSRLHSVKQDLTKRFSYMQEGQKIYFELYHTQDDGGTRTITYYTQRAYNTEAVQDHTYLICAQNGNLTLS